ncbi:MAG: SAM-dependent methyltransferase [Bacteroidetes bacterium]|nr:MAG: SAM-dependent methyltransferase [Bacteroidota bacterium]
MTKLDENYWESRWQAGRTGWDLGEPAPALITYLQNWSSDTRILIPGAGRAHEALWLHRHGYTEVYVCDWAPSALEHFRQAAPDFPAAHLLACDFFTLDLEVDLLIEHTFFCAIDPALRPQYVEKSYQLLASGGILAGLFWATHFEQDGPPFGGELAEYHRLFDPYFEFLQSELAALSVTPRKGREYFLELRKKDLV